MQHPTGGAVLRVHIERLALDCTVSSYEVERWFVDDGDAQAVLVALLELLSSAPVHTGGVLMDEEELAGT